MRVLQVVATSGGGVGRHVAMLVGGLTGSPGPDSADAVVVAAPGGDADFGWSRAGARVVAWDVADRPRTGDVRALWRLRALARQADVVHAHGARAGALAGLALAGPARGGGRRCPALVVTLHNAAVGGRAVRAVHGALERVVAARADVVLAVSPDIGDRLRARGARRVEAAVVPAPELPGPSMPADRTALGVAPSDALLLTVARLAPQKGLTLLLDALAMLREREVVALVAGEGPLRAELEARIARASLPVRLLGIRDDVPALMAAADLVVVPSVWEGQPLVVSEALAAGAAVVATDTGGVAALLGGAGMLVPPGDAGALAGAVAALLDDAPGRERMRAASRARAAELPGAAEAVAAARRAYAAAGASRLG